MGGRRQGLWVISLHLLPLVNREGMISTLGGSDGCEEAEPQRSHCESDPRWDMTSPSAPGVPARVWRQG